ncbi:hypothetical protein [uncultured Paraglaciecola sp.]|uniref:hypothetical protein n=1 Tax=uncultured Paraglaciecola sp. TaxID=1765024 RepID=UPI0025983A1C|nr:hypothetical protein [uncultured Paraglaciecola sp.]
MKIKKKEIAEFILSNMTARTYEKAALDSLISTIVSYQYLSQPMYAIDHLRRALVDYGYMAKDPSTDVYVIKAGVVGLQQRHELIQDKLEQVAKNHPEEKIECNYCDYVAKPVAMLNHYLKKHDFDRYLQRVTKEFGNDYSHG